jgi:hypothetical protein
MTTFRPFSLEATTPRRRKCYPMLIIYHVGRIIVAIATFALVAACIGMMG